MSAMKDVENILNLESSPSSFELDVLDGFSEEIKSIPSKYLYDERGSFLFEKITEQPEYYPTRSELEILHKRKEELLRLVGNEPFRLVELGVGDGEKTKVLLHYFLEKGLNFEYVLVDCCKELVQQVTARLKNEYPIKIIGLIADYSTALAWIRQENNKRNLVLFLGSSIGNFDRKQTPHFFHEIWNVLNDKDIVFIGFDLKKDIRIIERAYKDAAGITSEFYLNLLDRLNRELDADFNKEFFVHHSFYNVAEGRVEGWLVSTQPQKVTFGKLQKSFNFQAWEGIHLENSYKYSLQEIGELAKTMGFELESQLLDSKGYFADAIWQVDKISSYLLKFHE